MLPLSTLVPARYVIFFFFFFFFFFFCPFSRQQYETYGSQKRNENNPTFLLLREPPRGRRVQVI